jgi:protein-S-isoprenylcysteine O-methyltransferase Ste14
MATFDHRPKILVTGSTGKPVVQIGVIQRKEVYLEHKFGDEYLYYKSQVRRWL